MQFFQNSITILLMFLFPLNISGQTYIKSLILNGKIESIETFKYENLLNENGPYDRKLWETKIQKFNKNGYLIFSEESNLESSTISSETYVRDNRGNSLEIINNCDHPDLAGKIVRTFDKHDNELSRKKYNMDAELIMHEQKTYDKDDNELTCIRYDINDNLTINKQNVFVGKDKILYEKTISEQGFVDTLLSNQYDEQLNLTESKKYYMFGIHKSVEWFEYDEQNFLLKKQWKKIADSLWYSRLVPLRRHMADSLMVGLSVDTLRYRKIDTTLFSTIYLNDEKGNILEEKYYKKDQYQGVKQYKYDSRGVVAEISIQDANEKQVRLEIYNKQSIKIEEITSYGLYTKYDGLRNVTEMGSITSGPTFRNEYEYDEKGNWISKVMYSSEIPKFSTIRFITYY